MPDSLNVIGRAQASEALMPPEVVTPITEGLVTQSAVLANAKRTTMSTKKQIQPVLATLPEAFWVDGDTGLKQTTSQSWKGLNMTAEELAVIVPIPDALMADSSVNLFDIIRPRLIEAIGTKIDKAVLFGVDKPASWPAALVPAAKAAGNAIALGPKKNHADAVTELAEKIALEGFSVNGFISRPGLGWKLRGLKDETGSYYYGAPSATGDSARLFGYPLNEAIDGAWDPTQAELVMADFTKVIIGIRQDITFQMFSEGVITDSQGKVLLNLMQQDTKAMRVVMRLGYQVANPVTALAADETKRYPAGVITPAPAPTRA